MRTTGRPDADAGRGHAGPLRRRDRQPGADAAVLGRPGRQGHPAGRLRRAASTSGRPSWASGGCKRRARRRAVVRGAGRDRGPAAAADVAGAGADRAAARGGRRLRLLPVRVRGRRPGRARTRTAASGSPVHLPAAAPRPAPVPGRLLPAARSPARPTSSASTLVTMGSRVGEVTGELFAANAYRDYLELHGLSVQLTEALAEYWHARVRAELGFGGGGPGRRSTDMLRPGLPRRALLLRLPAPAPTSRTGRRSSSCSSPERIGVDALRGVPAAPRAVDRRDRRPPPRGEVLQRPLTRSPATADRRLAAVLLGHGRHAGRHRADLDRGRARAGRRARRHLDRRRRASRWSATPLLGLGRLHPRADRGSRPRRRRRSSSGCSTAWSPASRGAIPWPPGARELLVELVGPGRALRAGDDVLPAARRRRRSTSCRGHASARVVTGDEVRARQAAPRALPDGGRRCSASTRADCVAIEDSPTGVASAEAAGCVTVAVQGVVDVPPAPGRIRVGSLA